METRPDRTGKRGRHRDESGQALVEFALVLPLVILLVRVAFNGWNGIQLDLRLTSAARAGAITAAHDLSVDLTNNPGQALSPTDFSNASCDAKSTINAEEGVTGLYQCSNPSGADYVSISPPSQQFTVPSSGLGDSSITVRVVTITISGASVSLVPVVGNISVSAHATAEYS